MVIYLQSMSTVHTSGRSSNDRITSPPRESSSCSEGEPFGSHIGAIGPPGIHHMMTDESTENSGVRFTSKLTYIQFVYVISMNISWQINAPLRTNPRSRWKQLDSRARLLYPPIPPQNCAQNKRCCRVRQIDYDQDQFLTPSNGSKKTKGGEQELLSIRWDKSTTDRWEIKGGEGGVLSGDSPVGGGSCIAEYPRRGRRRRRSSPSLFEVLSSDETLPAPVQTNEPTTDLFSFFSWWRNHTLFFRGWPTLDLFSLFFLMSCGERIA
jgi:hypothetical protein